MKKILTFLLLFTAVMMSAQEVPASFPRKFLIEQFSGDWCQYCPPGMYAIAEHIDAATTPYIWLCDHLDDEYSTSKGNQVYNFANPNGVPAMMLNRTTQSQGFTFHPGYLPSMTVKDDTTAEASVVIKHTYNAETRQLDVTVSGQVAKTEVTEYLLTVLVKESGMIGKQSESQGYSWKGKGWKEFVHPRVVRNYITAALGDNVAVENQAYSQSYTFTLAEDWIAENCCVVAYITPTTKQPIINAEQAPVVAGTTGGEHFQPMAVTEKEAPSNNEKLTFDSIVVTKPSDNKLLLTLYSGKAIRSSAWGAMKQILTLEFNTTANALPTDTLDIQAGDTENTFTAGYYIPESATFGGSYLQYVDSKELEKGNIKVYHTWRLNTGKISIGKTGNFLAAGNFYNAKHYTITGVGLMPVSTDVENIQAPATYVEKFMRNGQVIIRKNGVEYDLLGNILE